MGKYKFNKDQLKFVEDKRGFKGWVKVILNYFLASLFLALLYYAVFALFISTEQERALERESALMEEEYLKMQQKMDVLENTIMNLQLRDREIYRSIFNAEPPVYSTFAGDDLFEGMDTTSIDAIVADSKLRLSVIEKGMGRVNASIGSIYANIDTLGSKVQEIPSIVPLRNFSIKQSGASVGKKVNPFYKNVVSHTGMDLLAGTGTEVLAAADGVVETASRKGRIEGNSIVINHKNGYVTKYNNLGDILVRKGQKVRQGAVIGRVGMSGMSFAPHLHYEVWLNEEMMDPVNYFFASLTPQMFKEMAVIVANTGQSLD
jgi:murein DD-endopeptidase MepM/ murein hydrolase activator NlpD